MWSHRGGMSILAAFKVGNREFVEQAEDLAGCLY